MTTHGVTERPRRPLRSVAAVLVGLLVVVVFSIATDQAFHALEIYPPWGEPMHDAGLNLLALAYRAAYTVLGGWVTARLAPSAPVAHALALGTIGLVLGALGGIAARELSPLWFLALVALIGPPCAWAGAKLHGRLQR